MAMAFGKAAAGGPLLVLYDGDDAKEHKQPAWPAPLATGPRSEAGGHRKMKVFSHSVALSRAISRTGGLAQRERPELDRCRSQLDV